MSRLILALAATTIVITLVSGCGGGGDNGWLPGNGSGTLSSSDQQVQSGAYYDSVWVRPDQDVTIRIRMNSTQVDPYIVLWDADGTVLATDDDSGSGRNAELVVNLYAGNDYEVGFSTYAAGSFGRYSYSFAELSYSAAASAAVELGDKTTKLPVSLLSKK
ncbi:MAG: hypothetical protein WCP21_08775 [Armatimonadota bacterium]